MRVYIDKLVYQVLDEFYDASMKKHITLDYPTVIAKIDRLEQAMYDFADKAGTIHTEPYRRDWKEAGYLELMRKAFILHTRSMHYQMENAFCTTMTQCMTN